MHEVTNALDQTNKEITTRFDLKNTGSKCQREDNVITVISDSDFNVGQVSQVLMGKLAKRKVNLRSLKKGDLVTSGKEVRQAITIRRGIDAPLAKAVKDLKNKTQASINEAKVRISGKKKDQLQAVIARLRETDYDLPLQFINFRD